MSCCCTTVSTGEVGIIETWGKFDRLATPGFHFLKCPCECLVGRLSLRVQQLEVRTSTKSKDDVTVDVIVAVQYKIINEIVAPEPFKMERGQGYGSTNAPASLEDKLLTDNAIEKHGAWRAYYKLTGVNEQFRAYIEDVVRSEIPRKTLDEVFEGKDDIGEWGLQRDYATRSHAFSLVSL
jgi:regulator of protease activity HflC (stomatin/prohibitin superfamily)